MSLAFCLSLLLSVCSAITGSREAQKPLQGTADGAAAPDFALPTVWSGAHYNIDDGSGQVSGLRQGWIAAQIRSCSRLILTLCRVSTGNDRWKSTRWMEAVSGFAAAIGPESAAENVSVSAVVRLRGGGRASASSRDVVVDERLVNGVRVHALENRTRHRVAALAEHGALFVTGRNIDVALCSGRCAPPLRCICKATA